MNYESTVDYKIVNLLIDHVVTHRHRQRDLTHVLHRPVEVAARAAGHHHLSEFNIEDLTTDIADMAQLTGVAYGGVAG